VKKKIRTDLALEVRESFPEDDVEIKGVVLTENYDEKNDIRVSVVNIKDERGAQAMQKPIGTYITIEAPKMNQSSSDYYKPASEEIARQLRTLAGSLKKEEVLVVGLGNREVTPDALGPQVVDNLFITRHLIKEYGESSKKKIILKCQCDLPRSDGPDGYGDSRNH
jgi:spore protease